MSKIEIPEYSLGEELVSSISHGIGALLGIAALVLSVVFSKNPITIVSSAIYGITLIILYLISCLYHSFSPRIKAKKFFVFLIMIRFICLFLVHICHIYLLVLVDLRDGLYGEFFLVYQFLELYLIRLI